MYCQIMITIVNFDWALEHYEYHYKPSYGLINLILIASLWSRSIITFSSVQFSSVEYIQVFDQT